MAMDLSAASNVLKTFYLPPVREILNNATILLSRLDRDETTQSVDGTSFTVPLHTGRNSASGVGVSENGTLPTAGNQGYSKAVVPNKYIYGRITVSGPLIAATKSNAGAFIRAIDSEIKGCMRDTLRSVNRQLHGDGRDALAFWTTADNSSGTVVDDGNGYIFTHLPNQAITCDLIDVSDNSTVLGDSIVVTLGAEVATGFDITWTGSVSGSADGDYLVVQDTLGKQMMGIQGIISAADPALLAGGLHGLTVASNSWWVAQTVGSYSSLHDLSFRLMQRVMSKVAVNSEFGQKDIKFILCSYDMRDKYVELCVNERHYYNTMTLDGGFEAVTYNGKPIVPDAQCRHGCMYFIVPETMAIFRTSDFDWMDKDGAVLKRVADKDQYEATLFHYGDLGCKQRNGNGVLLGINE